MNLIKNVLFLVLSTATVCGMSKLDQLLFLACEEGTLEDVHDAIEIGAKLDSQDECYNTPLHRACYHEKVEIVKHLVSISLDREIKIDSKDISGCTPLHLACARRSLPIVEYLMEIYLKKGLKIDSTTHDCKFTTLHTACVSGYLNVVKYLVEVYLANKININSTDCKGQTPFSLACLNGQLTTMKYLASVCWAKNIEIHKMDCGTTPLHSVCGYGYKVEHLKCLLSFGADWLARDRTKKQPLINPHRSFWTQFIKIAKMNKRELCTSIKSQDESTHELFGIWIRNTIFSQKPILPAYKELSDLYHRNNDTFNTAMEILFPDTNEREFIKYEIKKHYNISTTHSSQEKIKYFDIQLEYLSSRE